MDVQVIQFDGRVGMGTFEPWLKEFGCQIHRSRCDLEMVPTGTNLPILLLGGYMGVNDREKLPYLKMVSAWISEEVKLGRPLLAICLGGQLLAHSLGGAVFSQSKQEKGIHDITLTPEGKTDPLFAGFAETFVSFEWHNDSFEVPQGAKHLARTDTCPAQAFRYSNAWGLQFHPEVNEQIVADWCVRTGAGKEPVEQLIQNQEVYFHHSKLILENFIKFLLAARLPS